MQYSEERRAEILEKVYQELIKPRTLLSISKDKGMPCQDTLYEWIRTNKAFAEKYMRARDIQAERFAENIVEIVSKPLPELHKDPAFAGVAMRAELEKRKQQADAMKWFASKTAPKKYGDKAGDDTPTEKPGFNVAKK